MIFYLHKLQYSLIPYQNGNNAIFVQLQYYYLAFHHHRNIYQGQYMSHLTLFTNSSLSKLECYFEWLQGKLRIPGSHQDPFFFFLNENEYIKKKKAKGMQYPTAKIQNLNVIFILDESHITSHII